VTRKRILIHGVDFSGAADAGRRIWIASGKPRGRALALTSCIPGRELPGSGRSRTGSLRALRAFIASATDAVFGMDFPFGLPMELLTESSWDRFALRFPEAHRSADAFRNWCRARTPGRESKRVTDAETATPFAPSNLRLYRQTFYGIRDILSPLVRDGLVCVLPMQRRRARGAWLIEVCPASTLKSEGLYRHYKGPGAAPAASRRRILRSLCARGLLVPPASGIASGIVADRGGDALDSVVAALAAARYVRTGGPRGSVKETARREGLVYV